MAVRDELCCLSVCLSYIALRCRYSRLSISARKIFFFSRETFRRGGDSSIGTLSVREVPPSLLFCSCCCCCCCSYYYYVLGRYYARAIVGGMFIARRLTRRQSASFSPLRPGLSSGLVDHPCRVARPILSFMSGPSKSLLIPA